MDVIIPASQELLARTLLSSASLVDEAVRAFAAAYPAWRNTAPGDRIQRLFKLMVAIDEHIEVLAYTITV